MKNKMMWDQFKSKKALFFIAQGIGILIVFAIVYAYASFKYHPIRQEYVEYSIMLYGILLFFYGISIEKKNSQQKSNKNEE